VSCDWKASDFDDETRDFGAESGSGLGEAGDWEEQEGGKEAGSDFCCCSGGGKNDAPDTLEAG
jgi:hypothetical protein